MSEHVVATAAAAATAGDAATVDELPDLPGLGLCDDACDGDDADEDGVLLRRGGTGPANEADATHQDPALYVAVTNIKSDDNLGSLLRTAGAFGAREVLVVSAERTHAAPESCPPCSESFKKTKPACPRCCKKSPKPVSVSPSEAGATPRPRDPDRRERD
mmetsp:Transcript_31381/g.97108  ORF Transcript_31381/g.97108 Transcript_31381/m.97108 type:complete len:160 (-) Transcript_31381:41-520(-)